MSLINYLSNVNCTWHVHYHSRLGRVGFQQYGMPVAGPMDSESYLLGQSSGNGRNGRFECTLLPPTLTVKAHVSLFFHRGRHGPNH